MTLQRLVLDFHSSSGPSTAARMAPAQVLKRGAVGGTQLREALEALEGRVDVIGTSGYDVREDVIVAETDRQREEGAA